MVDYFYGHSRRLLHQESKLGLCKIQEICIPRAYWTRGQITYRLAKKTAQNCTAGKSQPSWNTSNVGISGTGDIFIKQRPSALRQQLNWTHRIKYAAYVTNLLFPKLSDHHRMSEWNFRTRKTIAKEAIWVSQFLDLLNEFLRTKIMHHVKANISLPCQRNNPLHSVCACACAFVATNLQITNMASMQRSLYLLYARVICPIVLPNWSQCIDVFILLIPFFV